MTDSNLQPDKEILGTNDKFHFFVPIELVKADAGKDAVRWIQGIASTADKDLQGEIVVQKGIDFTYFLTRGYINDDHKDGPENKVGEPTECRLTADGLWIKGFLYKGKEKSDRWWEHLQVLSTSESKRKVGFSIQGKVLRRDGNTIVKCWLQDVAITASPVNTHTWAEVAKSLSAQKWCLHPSSDVCKSCGGCALVPVQTEMSETEIEKSLGDRISYPEAVAFIQQTKGYSQVVAKALADAIFAAQGIQ